MTTQDRRAAEEIALNTAHPNNRTNCADAIFAALQKAREEERQFQADAENRWQWDMTRRGLYFWCGVNVGERLVKAAKALAAALGDERIVAEAERIRALPESET